MKKFMFIVAVMMLIGCAANTNRVPDGKTYDNDWVKDEAYCLKQSHYVTGFFAANPIALVWNIDASKKYNQCLRELGWLE